MTNSHTVSQVRQSKRYGINAKRTNTTDNTGDQFKKLSTILNAVNRFKNFATQRKDDAQVRGTEMCRYGRDMGDMSGSKRQQIQNIMKDRKDSQIDIKKIQIGKSNPFTKYMQTSTDKSKVMYQIKYTPNDSLVLSSSNSRQASFEDDRPLKLPPVILPPIYSSPERELARRDLSPPTLVPSGTTKTMSETEWRELEHCRYLRLSIPNKFTAKKNYTTIYH